MSPSMAKRDAGDMVKSEGETARDYPEEALNVITALGREGRGRPDLMQGGS